MKRKLFVAITALALLALPALAFAEESRAWDALRPASEFAKDIELIVKWLLLVVSAVLFAISAMAYYKSGSRRVMFISAAFFLFVVASLVKIFDIYFSPGYFFSEASSDLMQLLIMLIIFVAVFVRKSYNKFFEKDSK